MRLLFCSLLCLAASVCRAEIPELFRNPDVNPAILAKAVNHFVALGEKRALAVFMDYDPERVNWVCMILFLPKKHQPPLDGPKTNGPWKAPFNDIPDFDLPCYPAAAAGRSYFVLVKASTYGGIGEPVKSFTARCRAEGVFRTKPIPVPTHAEAQADALALRKSEDWLDIQW